MNNDATNTYTYDSENRLISANNPSHITSYTYDPFGRRISKTVDTVTTSYLYDGDQVICEYDSTDTLIAKYTYGTGIDEAVTMERGGATYYYHYDGLGSVTALTDANGDLTESYSYDIFGKVTSSFSNVGNPYYFTGRRYDDETGLYYYRARMYNPSSGRFNQVDKREIFGLASLYDYCFNSPLNYRDPFGLDTYIVNRSLHVLGGKGDEPKSYYNPGSHTYAATTDNGKVTHTYSRTPDGWVKDDPTDMKVAQEAIDKKLAVKLAGEELDEHVEEEYEAQKDEESLFPVMPPWKNCKHETRELLQNAVDRWEEDIRKRSYEKPKSQKKDVKCVK